MRATIDLNRDPVNWILPKSRLPPVVGVTAMPNTEHLDLLRAIENVVDHAILANHEAPETLPLAPHEHDVVALPWRDDQQPETCNDLSTDPARKCGEFAGRVIDEAGDED